MKNPNAIITSDYGPIIINVNDGVIAKHISSLGYWATDDINLIKQIIEHQLKNSENLTFYDIGANIGTHSLAISKSFYSKVTIRAFEAQRQIYNMLCGTMAINGLSNVYCHHNAISDISGVNIEINLPDYGKSNNFGGLELIKPVNSDNSSMIINDHEIVTTLSIDSFNERIDFIKMDIEGMENKALLGGTEAISRWRPVCFIEILKTDVNYVLDFFKSKDYLGFQKNADLIALPRELAIQIDGAHRIF